MSCLRTAAICEAKFLRLRAGGSWQAGSYSTARCGPTIGTRPTPYATQIAVGATPRTTRPRKNHRCRGCTDSMTPWRSGLPHPIEVLVASPWPDRPLLLGTQGCPRQQHESGVLHQGFREADRVPMVRGLPRLAPRGHAPWQPTAQHLRPVAASVAPQGVAGGGSQRRTPPLCSERLGPCSAVAYTVACGSAQVRKLKVYSLWLDGRHIPYVRGTLSTLLEPLN